MGGFGGRLDDLYREHHLHPRLPLVTPSRLPPCVRRGERRTTSGDGVWFTGWGCCGWGCSRLGHSELVVFVTIGGVNVVISCGGVSLNS
jgi:hypothetical protein